MLSNSFKRCSLLIFFCAIAVLLLYYFLALPAQAFVDGPHHSTLTLPKAQQPDCPAQSADPQAPASLEFCSPRYRGYVGGPFGSHITLVGKNFSSQPTALVILSTHEPVNEKTIEECVSQKLQDCFPLSLHSEEFSSPQFLDYIFTWTFKTKPGDFVVAAVVGQKIIVSSPASAFTLLSSQPPCIVISNANTGGSNCSQAQVLPLTAGSLITIRGSNWLLGPQQPVRQTVMITATCTNSDGHSAQTSYSAEPGASGSFLLRKVWPQNLTGMCEITASNRLQRNIANTVADGALTFGGPDDTTMLLIEAQQPILPVPSSDILDTVSLLGVIPAGLGLLICLIIFLRQQSGPSQLLTSFSSINTALVTLKETASFQRKPERSQEISTASNVLPDPYYLLTPIKLLNAVTVSLAGRSANRDAEQMQRRAVRGALAQGNLETIIHWMFVMLQSNPAIWEELLTEIKNARIDVISIEDKNLAFQSLRMANQGDKNVLEYCNTAIVLYRWLINTIEPDTIAAADIYYNLGVAYYSLPGIEIKANIAHIKKALEWYEQALQIYRTNQLHKSKKWGKKLSSTVSENGSISATLHNIGDAYLYYSNIQGKNRNDRIERAIYSYQLAINASHNFPHILSSTHEHIGYAYFIRTSGRREENLSKAIDHYQRALKDGTPNSRRYALLQNSLGDVYTTHYEVSRDKNSLQQALTCYQDALDLYQVNDPTNKNMPRIDEKIKRVEEALQQRR